MAQKQTSMTAKQYRQLKPGKPSKYRSKRCVIDGETFHSIGEGKRWVLLRHMERTGQIINLRRQVKFDLHAHSEKGYGNPRIGGYVADFVYQGGAGDMPVVEDWKGVQTPLSAWKQKHFVAEYPLHIFKLTGPAAKRRRK
jgi:hypothetical protein